MVASTEEILSWVNSRINEILLRPRMWGGKEAVEMQLLSLFELKEFTKDSHTGRPTLLESYQSYVRCKYPTVYLCLTSISMEEMILEINGFIKFRGL
jgi:hypothetical protein